MIYKTFLILYIFSFSITAQNMSEIDSLQEVYAKSTTSDEKTTSLIAIAYYYKYENTDSLMHYIKKIKVINKNGQNKSALFDEYLFDSFIATQKKEDAKAILKIDKASQLALEMKNPILEGRAYFYKSTIYHYLKRDFSKALEYKLKAEASFNKTDTITNSTITNLASIAFIYNKFNNYEQALLYINKTTSLLHKGINPMIKGHCYNTLGIIYSDLNDHDKALEFLNISRDLHEQNNNSLSKISAEHNIGIVHFKKGDLLKAKKIFKESLKDTSNYIHEQNFNENRTIGCHLYLGKIALKKQDYNTSLTHLNYVEFNSENKYLDLNIEAKLEKSKLFYERNEYKKALLQIKSLIKLVEKDGLFLNELEAVYLLQSKIYHYLKKTDKELNSYKNYIGIKNRQDSINNKFNIESLKLKFIQEKANKEIAEQQRTIKSLEGKDEIKTKNNLLLIFSLTITIIFSIILFFRHKKLNHINKIRWAAEKEIKDLKQSQLLFDVETKKHQLTDFAIHITEKNDLLEKIKSQIISANIDYNNPGIKDLLFFINDDIHKNKEKSQLYSSIDNKNDSFYNDLTLKHPNLNEKEKKIATLIRLGHSSKQISLQLNIAKVSVNNYRYSLRKKLNLSRGENLINFIKSI